MCRSLGSVLLYIYWPCGLHVENARFYCVFLVGVHPIFLFLPQPTMDVATMLQSVVFMHFVQNNRETYQAILFSCLPAWNKWRCVLDWNGGDTWMDSGFLPLQRVLVLGSVVGEGDVKRARTHWLTGSGGGGGVRGKISGGDERIRGNKVLLKLHTLFPDNHTAATTWDI